MPQQHHLSSGSWKDTCRSPAKTPHVRKTRTHPTFLPYRARDPFREARKHISTICLTVPSVPPPQTWAKDDEEAGVAQTPPTPRAEGRLRLLWGGREEAKNASGARTDAGRLQGSYLSRTNNPRMEKPKTVPSTYRQLVLLLLDGSNPNISQPPQSAASPFGRASLSTIIIGENLSCFLWY